MGVGRMGVAVLMIVIITVPNIRKTREVAFAEEG